MYKVEAGHCEGKARSNLQLTKTEIASSFHSSQRHDCMFGMWARVVNESDRIFENWYILALILETP